MLDEVLRGRLRLLLARLQEAGVQGVALGCTELASLVPLCAEIGLQVAEARLAGAGGILIIVRMLDRPALDALMNNTLGSLPSKETCDPGQYDQTLLTAHFIGIEGVPFVVAPDGHVSKGRPKNLKSWLESAE